MTQTIETLQTPAQDEYAIVATFSKQSLDVLTHIQSQISERLGDAVWLTPRAALHSTLMEIICDRDYGTVSRKEIFTSWYEEYNQTVSEILASLSPFEITFSELEVSQRAIIARLDNSDVFNDIRSQLLASIKLPNGTKMPPDITHCSLARFTKSVDLEDVQSKTSNIDVNFTENISYFQLLKDLGPPTFEPKLIQDYPLSA